MAVRDVPVPPQLRLRRAIRRFPPVRSLNVIRQVAAHPSNNGQVGRAIARSLQWQVRSRRSPEPLELTVWGDMRFRCYPRSNSASNIVYFTERFDPAEMRVIEAVVQPGDTVIDAGANVGGYTLFLARLVGPSGTVVAIEPGGTAADRLEENVELNGLQQVRVERVAVGSRPGEATMTVNSDVSNTLTVGPGVADVTSIAVVPLDDLATQATFMKIDVEGFEFEALLGASRLLQNRPVLQIEITEHLLRRMDTSGQAIREHLHEIGYRTGYPLLEGRGVRLDTSAGRNLFAIPADRWDEIDAGIA